MFTDEEPTFETQRRAMDGWAYLGFHTSLDARWFKTLVVTSPSCAADLFQRLTHWVTPGAWRHEAIVLAHFGDPSNDDPSLFREVSQRIVMPRADVPLAAAALRGVRLEVPTQRRAAPAVDG